MLALKNWSHELRMCLNHSQSGVEQATAEIEVALQRWHSHPGNAQCRRKVSSDVSNLRWMIEQHFRTLIERDVPQHITRDSTEIHDHLLAMASFQNRLLYLLSEINRQVDSVVASAPEIAKVIRLFQQFHAQLICEEAEERLLVDEVTN